MSGSCTYAGEDTTKYERIKLCGISEREKCADDIWKACKPKVQIWNQTFLVQGLLCGYRREKCEKIQEYIQKQLKEDLEYDQMTLKEYIDPFTGEPVKQSK